MSDRNTSTRPPANLTELRALIDSVVTPDHWRAIRRALERAAEKGDRRAARLLAQYHDRLPAARPPAVPPGGRIYYVLVPEGVPIPDILIRIPDDIPPPSSPPDDDPSGDVPE